MDQQQLEQLRGICAEAGFTRKGNAFFRIVGDGVLQIIRARYERVFRAHILYVGLLSMYDCLTPRHFTAAGCQQRNADIQPACTAEQWHPRRHRRLSAEKLRAESNFRQILHRP